LTILKEKRKKEKEEEKRREEGEKKGLVKIRFSGGTENKKT